MPDLTVTEVATRLKVTPLTVRFWLRSGALVGIAPDDRAACRIRETDLATFLDTRRRCAAAGQDGRRGSCKEPIWTLPTWRR